MLIYRNHIDGYYYTYKIYGHIPILLVDKRDRYIPKILFNDNEIIQHEQLAIDMGILEE